MVKKSSERAVENPGRLRRGPDGRTAAERLQEAYGHWKDRTGGTQQRLAEEANRIMGYGEEDRNRLQQQEISQLLNGESDLAQSGRGPAIAEVLEVPPAWLQYGFGARDALPSFSARQLQALKDLGVLRDKG